MEQVQLIQLGAALLGGGAAGAIITALVTSYRARVQPIGKRVEILPLFTPEFGGPSFSTSVTVSDGNVDCKFPNLHLAEIQIVNRGNRDLPSFTFGITLEGTDRAIHIDPKGLDRHHAASLMSICTPASPSSSIDLELRPLNRGDSYTIRVFLVVEHGKPQPLKIGTSEAVRFTEIPSVAETMAIAVSTLSFRLGPFELRLPR
jgi:hypothetical protein